jgi:hypothetical protein
MAVSTDIPESPTSSETVFFERIHRHRTSREIGGMLFGLAMGAFMAYMASDSTDRFGLSCFAIMFFMFGGLWAWKWFLGVDRIVRITEKRIQDGAESWRWNEIVYFGGEFEGKLVCLYFAMPRMKLAGIVTPRMLETTSRLSVEEFYTLCDQIRDTIGDRYPRLSIDKEITSSSG